jgi:hypothetical protein
MLPDLAQYLLEIVGKQLGERGVITHDEIPGCIAKLEAAVGADREAQAEHHGLNHLDDKDHASHTPIGLAQRAFPFLDMLRQSQKESADILWGV